MRPLGLAPVRRLSGWCRRREHYGQRSSESAAQPDRWLHRPAMHHRPEIPRQQGAVHRWRIDASATPRAERLRTKIPRTARSSLSSRSRHSLSAWCRLIRRSAPWRPAHCRQIGETGWQPRRSGWARCFKCSAFLPMQLRFDPHRPRHDAGRAALGHGTNTAAPVTRPARRSSSAWFASARG